MSCRHLNSSVSTTSFRNLANAASLSLALMSTYTLPTSGFVLKIFSIRTFARKPVPPVMRKFLAPRNSATPIPPPAAPGGSPCAGSTKDGSGGGGLDEPAAVAEDDDEQHATAPPPCRRLDDDDSSGRRRPRRRRDPSAAPKPGRTARERFTQELPIGPRARGRKEMQVRAWWCARVSSPARARLRFAAG
uniref:Uncharacterized protein n=1 Tax=Zea mays TaxID=4577 RepID=C4J442_MAIZE|nr:unknown [Zea mays]